LNVRPAVQSNALGLNIKCYIKILPLDIVLAKADGQHGNDPFGRMAYKTMPLERKEGNVVSIGETAGVSNLGRNTELAVVEATSHAHSVHKCKGGGVPIASDWKGNVNSCPKPIGPLPHVGDMCGMVSSKVPSQCMDMALAKASAPQGHNPVGAMAYKACWSNGI